MDYAKKVVVLSVAHRGRQVVAPRSALSGPGRELFRKGKVVDVSCGDERAGRNSIGEIRIGSSLWRSGSNTWTKEEN